MNIAIQTNEGKQLDLTNVKYMTFENVEYALLPVLSKTQTSPLNNVVFTDQSNINRNLDAFFETENTPVQTMQPVRKVRRKIRVKRTHPNSIAHKVREWLSTAKPGQTTVFKSDTEYAIRVACEIAGVKAKIYTLKRGHFSVTYDRKKVYARMRTA